MKDDVKKSDVIGEKVRALSKKALSDLMRGAVKPQVGAGTIWETKEVKIKPSRMFVDTSYQRHPKQRMANHKKIIKEGYSLKRAEPFHVHVRESGEVAILDGGGRHYIHTVLLNLPDDPIVCLDHFNCKTPKDEAAVFLGLNTPHRRKVNDTQRQRALVMMGDKDAIRIQNSINAAGLVIGGSGRNGIPYAAAHFLDLMGNTDDVGVIKHAAWSDFKPDSWAYMALGGLLRAVPRIDKKRLIAGLQKWSPTRILAAVLSSSYGKPHAGDMPPLIADFIARNIYNKGLHITSKRIAPRWEEVDKLCTEKPFSDRWRRSHMK